MAKSRYKDPFTRVRNSRKGEPAFVFGSGPSLHQVDKAIRFNELGVQICVNAAILRYPNAQYFFSADRRIVFRKHWQVVRGRVNSGNENPTPVLQNKSMHFMRMFGGVPGLDAKSIVYGPSKKSGPLRVTDEKLDVGNTSVQGAVHFAVVLGCSPIYLFGVDCADGPDGKRHYMEYADEPSDKWFVPQADPKHTEDSLNAMMQRWGLFANRLNGTRVVNVSGGILKAFPRITIDAFLREVSG